MDVKQLIMEEFERPYCIRGYHIYQEVWTAAVDKELACDRLHDLTYQSPSMESTATRILWD